VEIELMVMCAAGATIGRPRPAGSVRATQRATALARGVKVEFELLAPTESDPTVSFQSDNGFVGFAQTRSGVRADIAADAIGWAPRLVSS
jgi:hypothetical protein